MKREWILGLATAAGMSLLTALPIFGSDKAVSNIKKPSTDASKPVVIASQQPVKGTNLSAKTINPTTDVKKTTEKKNTEKKSETVGKVTSSATVNAKPAVNVKPVTKTNPVANVKPAMKINTVSNVKPASDMKSMSGSKTVTAAKPAAFVKPVVETKPVANVKTSVNAKPATSNEKPVLKAKAKPAIAKPITMSKPAPPIKLAINTKPVEQTKPVVNAKPVVNTKQVVASKPVINSKPAVDVKPIVEKKPTVNAKPAVESKPAVKSNKPKMNAPKKITAAEPASKKIEKVAINNVAPVQRTNSIQLPTGWDRINLTNDQRDKAMVISDKYSAEIKKMEAQLEAAKANREKELSALLTPEQRNQFVNSNGQGQKTPTTNGKVKAEIKRTTPINRVSKLAAAPIEKKGRTQK
jgi:hypothetical protein